MITLRKAAERGHFNFGWLDTWHSFSFGDYHDPAHMGFSDLRVINQDRVAAGMGFDTHGHRDMEIVTYIVRGALQHRDSLGTTSIIRPGELQRMTAGTGIRHSEFNPSSDEAVDLLQIWILPEQNGLTPGDEQKDFTSLNTKGPLQLLASRDGREGSLVVHQDISVFRGQLKAGDAVQHICKERNVWVQLIRGALKAQDQQLQAGDGAAIRNETHVLLQAATDAEFLLFDLRP